MERLLPRRGVLHRRQGGQESGSFLLRPSSGLRAMALGSRGRDLPLWLTSHQRRKYELTETPSLPPSFHPVTPVPVQRGESLRQTRFRKNFRFPVGWTGGQYV